MVFLLRKKYKENNKSTNKNNKKDLPNSIIPVQVNRRHNDAK